MSPPKRSPTDKTDLAKTGRSPATNGSVPRRVRLKPRSKTLPEWCPDRFRLYSVEDLGRMPKSEMLVRPYLAARQLTCLFGKGDTYKSFVALNWACTLARDGRHVIYIAAEGGEGIRGRVTAWMIHHDVSALPALHVMPDNVNLHLELESK